MTSKVVELRQRLMDGRGFLTGTVSVLDLLISAAHAEGVVEGAEQERERIRNLGTLHDKGNGFPFYSVVASVLAPTKK